MENLIFVIWASKSGTQFQNSLKVNHDPLLRDVSLFSGGGGRATSFLNNAPKKL